MGQNLPVKGDGRESMTSTDSLSSVEIPGAVIERLKQIMEEKCRKIEERLSCKLLVLMMAERWASIERRTVDDVLKFLTEHGDQYADAKHLNVMLHSSGGDADAAYQIAKLLNTFTKKHKMRLNFLIPRMAKSAATLLACSGDRILMTQIAELGPIDPQIMTPTGRWISARTVRDSINELLEIIEQRTHLSAQRLSLLFGELPLMEIGQFNRLIRYVKNLLAELLRMRMFRGRKGEQRLKDVCARLTEGYEYHGKPIMFDEAKKIGLKVHLLKGEDEEVVLDAYWSFLSHAELLESYAAALLQALPTPIYIPTRTQIEHGILYLPLTAETLLGEEVPRPPLRRRHH